MTRRTLTIIFYLAIMGTAIMAPAILGAVLRVFLRPMPPRTLSILSGHSFVLYPGAANVIRIGVEKQKNPEGK